MIRDDKCNLSVQRIGEVVCGKKSDSKTGDRPLSTSWELTETIIDWLIGTLIVDLVWLDLIELAYL